MNFLDLGNDALEDVGAVDLVFDVIGGDIQKRSAALIRPGKLPEYKRLCEQAMEIVRTQDTGTPQYEIFFNHDETEAIVYERYRDIDAAMEHFAHIGHIMASLTATADVTGEVLGKWSEKMQLGDGGPKLFTPWLVLADHESSA